MTIMVYQSSCWCIKLSFYDAETIFCDRGVKTRPSLTGSFAYFSTSFPFNIKISIQVPSHLSRDLSTSHISCPLSLSPRPKDDNPTTASGLRTGSLFQQICVQTQQVTNLSKHFYTSGDLKSERGGGGWAGDSQRERSEACEVCHCGLAGVRGTNCQNLHALSVCCGGLRHQVASLRIQDLCRAKISNIKSFSNLHFCLRGLGKHHR